MLFIKKRDGSIQKFDSMKIEQAVLSAFLDVDGEITDYAEKKAHNIAEYIKNEAESADRTFSVEEVQDLVENGLMSGRRKDVARSYIQYRYERSKVREHNTNFMKEVTRKLEASAVENQNANVDERSFGGRIGEASRALTKKFALDYCMSEMSRNNHLNNEIYIHDLDSYAVGMHNCLTIPFDKLLAEGFNTRQTDVRPANSVNTAFQLVAVIFQLQSLQQFGGVSASHIDWTMVPYVRKSFKKHLRDGLTYVEHLSEYKTNRFDRWLDNDPKHPDGLIHFDDTEFQSLHPDAWDYALEMTKRETHQAVEGMYHNLKN